jgi:hypothetical protein
MQVRLSVTVGRSIATLNLRTDLLLKTFGSCQPELHAEFVLPPFSTLTNAQPGSATTSVHRCFMLQCTASMLHITYANRPFTEPLSQPVQSCNSITSTAGLLHCCCLLLQGSGRWWRQRLMC